MGSDKTTKGRTAVGSRASISGAAVEISLTGDYGWWTTAVGTTYACGKNSSEARKRELRHSN